MVSTDKLIIVLKEKKVLANDFSPIANASLSEQDIDSLTKAEILLVIEENFGCSFQDVNDRNISSFEDILKIINA